MGVEFDENKYPLIAIILNISYALNKKIKNRQTQNIIYNECVNELYLRLPNKNDVKFFDFHLKYDKFGDEIKIVPSNILTALWFINIFPKNGSETLKNKEYITATHKYKFDGRSKTLKIL